MDYTMEDKYRLIKSRLLESKEKNPLLILKSIMKDDFINMHGPEHHFLDGASLMIAMKNNGLDFDLSACLDKLAERTIKMPGAMCGYWGVCGSITSVAACFAVIDGTGPLSSDETYSDHMEFISRVIAIMSKIGGPRCCKRNAFISLGEGIKYANEHYGLKIENNVYVCEFSSRNKQCIKDRCPFHHK